MQNDAGILMISTAPKQVCIILDYIVWNDLALLLTSQIKQDKLNISIQWQCIYCKMLLGILKLWIMLCKYIYCTWRKLFLPCFYPCINSSLCFMTIQKIPPFWYNREYNMGDNDPEKDELVSENNNVAYYETEDDEEEMTREEKMVFSVKNGLLSSSSGTVYDRTTVLIEQDPIGLDDEEEDDEEGGNNNNLVTFLSENSEDNFYLISDPDGMAQGYVHHTISPDQIQFTINPGSTPMPRNIEGATLTLQSECPETKVREVSV